MFKHTNLAISDWLTSD